MIDVTEKTFEIEIRRCREPIVVMFYADWCGKCAMMKDVVEEAEKKYKRKLKFCAVEIEESPGLAEEYGADIVPTFVLFKNGKAESMMQGLLDEKVFDERIRKLL